MVKGSKIDLGKICGQVCMLHAIPHPNIERSDSVRMKKIAT